MAVDIPAHLHDLEIELDRLKVLYEQHFVGIEKQPPSVARKDCEKHIQWLLVQNIGNTAMRFRFQMLMRRWKLYSERWDRILREIETGTFSPHVARARRRLEAEQAALRARRLSATGLNRINQEALAEAKAKAEAEQAASRPSPDETAGAGGSSASLSATTGDFDFAFTGVRGAPASELDDEVDKALSMLTESAPTQPLQSTPSRPVRVVPPPPVERPPVPGMSDGDLRQLHQRYQQALKESGDGRMVKYESLVDSLKKQVPGILTKNQCDLVSFDVALKDGKVVLKATPKRRRPPVGDPSKG